MIIWFVFFYKIINEHFASSEYYMYSILQATSGKIQILIEMSAYESFQLINCVFAISNSTINFQNNF